ncbi:nucleotidyltransferase family protein [uncultured Bacteroides sp.]|uniref:nucleotidyltransferase family protein n=1 Tax=uncultured Bacteroides sp. TaxID=162156 RepID=UPI00280BAFF5|nr:nucleotidyltransferase family protein [uncultured Bacteroides sp.]
MEKIHAALLVLLRAGLWEREVEDTSCFPLTEEEWKKVYLLSRQQTVTGVVFQGILLLAEEFLPSESLLVRWMAETDAIERKNRRMNQVLASLVQMFISIGVSPVLQKGQGVASFYEKPLWRECGDIDFYFESQQEFERASYFVRRCKLQEEKMPDQSVAYTWKGVQIEHHTRLLDLHNPFLRYYAGQLVSQYGYSHMAIGKEKELEITVPSPVLNLLLQSLHILKHALGWGIGLRQLCDLARTCYILYQEVDAAEMKKICFRLGLGRWHGLLHACLVDHLGLPMECLPYPDRASEASPLLDIIWRGGNFGQFDAENLRLAVPLWKRKWQTACAFRRNMGFAFHYAPKESFWIVSSLLKGQFK